MLRYLKIFLLLLLTAQFSAGQKLVNSPYSRIGPGTLEPTGSFKSLGMGRTGVAHNDPLNISYQNPASYCSVDTNSFVFDFGLDYRIIVLDDGIDKYQSDDMNFHHLVMAFPISKKIGVATGIIPYSSGYYNINLVIDSDHPDYDPIIGETEAVHKGSGGYNKFFFGLGVNPVGRLSVGANMTFLFGTISRTNSYRFIDDSYSFDNIQNETVQIQGFNFDLGAQYNFEIKNDLIATTGVTYSTPANYKGQTENLQALYTGAQSSYDTLSYSATDDELITLPGKLALGLALSRKENFLITADYTMSNWSKAVFLGQESFFVKSNSINFGAEYIPNINANFNFLNRVAYRLGGHITNSHLMVDGEQIQEFGITFGAGLPLRRSNSKINLYFEYGTRGASPEINLHKETFYNFGLSLNFYDYWFLKRKYD